MEFEEGNALTVDNVSVEGTVAPGGWRVATKWDPSRVRKGILAHPPVVSAIVKCVHS